MRPFSAYSLAVLGFPLHGILRIAGLLAWWLASPRSECSKSSGGSYKFSCKILLEVIWCHILLIKVVILIDQPRFKHEREPLVHMHLNHMYLYHMHLYTFAIISIEKTPKNVRYILKFDRSCQKYPANNLYFVLS